MNSTLMFINLLIGNLLKISLIISTIASGYILISVVVFKDTSLKSLFSTWSFPMLLALLLDVYLETDC
jgi:hypothetical protein